MAKYQGQGKLLGINSYIKDNQEKVIYTVVEGSQDSQTQLFGQVETKTIIEDKAVLDNPQLFMTVFYDIDVQQFGQKTSIRASNIRAK